MSEIDHEEAVPGLPNFLNRRHPNCWEALTMNSIGIQAVQMKELKAKAEAKAKAATEESDMSAKAKTVAKNAKPKKGTKPDAMSNARMPLKAVREGSKLADIVALLTRKEGCTTADILKATGWPAVSVPQQAAAAGLELRKEKQGSVTRYWATRRA